jgi:hypothetical protein
MMLPADSSKLICSKESSAAAAISARKDALADGVTEERSPSSTITSDVKVAAVGAAVLAQEGDGVG